MKLRKNALTTAFAIGATMFVPRIVSAQEGGTIDVNIDDAGFQITDLGDLITGLLNMVLFIAALLVFAYLIWGGIQWITSGGDKGKTEEARNKITAAIVGLAVVAASYAIFRVALTFLGIANPLDGSFEIPTAYDN